MYSKKAVSRKDNDNYERKWQEQVSTSKGMQQQYNVQNLGIHSVQQAIDHNIITNEQAQESKIRQKVNEPKKLNNKDFQLKEESIQNYAKDQVDDGIKTEECKEILRQGEILNDIKDNSCIQIEDKQKKKGGFFSNLFSSLNPFSNTKKEKYSAQQQFSYNYSTQRNKVSQPRKFVGKKVKEKVYEPHEVVDKFDNLGGTQFDLGKDGQFKGYIVVIGQFYNFEIENTANALTNKGFDVIVCYDEQNFIEYYKTVGHVGIIISSGGNYINMTEKQFIDSVLEQHNKGKGLWIFADNSPYHRHANSILNQMFEIKIEGDDYGNKELTLGDKEQTGQFGQHMITQGIEHLYEGITISYPINPGALQVLATSTHGKPVVCYADHNITGNNGRILVDCGFTKLYCHFDTSGTARYIVNAVVWLLDLDTKIIKIENKDKDAQNQMIKDIQVQEEHKQN